MTPDYIHEAPREAIDAIEKYNDAINSLGLRGELDWMYYPDIYAFIEWGMSFCKLEKQLKEIDNDKNRHR